MKKKNTYINVISAFAITSIIAGAFLITSCGNNSSTGKFTEERLLVSKGEYFDISNYYKGKNAEFFSMDESIVISNANKFVGINPGLTYIYSVVEGKKNGFIEIYVKDELSSPEDIDVSDTGLISWSNVFSFANGERKDATYEIKVNDQLIETADSFYQLEEEGIYDFRIRAVGEDMVDPSPWSGNIKLYYKHLEKPTDLKFTPDEDVNTTKGVLSWGRVAGATYKVTVNGILYETSSDRLELDFSALKGSVVSISVEAVDMMGNFLSSKGSMSLRRLVAPKMEYAAGKLTWKEVEGATKYHIIYTNEAGVKADFTTTETSTDLNEADAGIYTISIQSVAGENMLSSLNSTFEKRVAKLQTANVSYSLGEAYVDINISSDSDYLKNFVINKNNEKIAAKIESGKSTTVRVPLTEGKYDFSVQSLPSYDSADVLPINGISSVLGSNFSEIKTIYMLGQAKNLTHSFDESGKSVLTFDNIEEAEDYEVFVNGRRTGFTSSESSGKTILNLGVIDRASYALEDDLTFEFKIVAKKNSDTINSTTTKEVKIFNKVVGLVAGGTDINSNKYTWTGIANAKYRVKIYRAKDSNFASDDLELIVDEETSSTETAAMSGGFYKIEVQTLSTDENLYWSSNSVMSDTFIISEEEENPYLLDFYYNSEHSSDLSGYEIKFKNPAAAQSPYLNPRKYEIYINGSKIAEGIAKTEEEILTYRFSSGYKFDSGSAKIEIRTLCTDEEMQKIYKPSAASVLNVEKLSTPEKSSVSLEGDNTLRVALQKNAERLIFTDSLGEEFKSGDEYLQAIDLTSFAGSFDLNVRYDMHKTFESETPFTEGTYYVESDTFTIHCRRAEVPTSFKYRKKVISFDHTGEVEEFDLTFLVKTKNDPAGKTWRTRIASKSYNLDNLIGKLDSEFDYYYSQKTEMQISVYACISKYVGDIFYIPSINEVETNRGMTSITVTQLSNVTDLTYNKAEDKLTWSSENVKGTEYEIYYNGALQDVVRTTASEGERNYYEYSLAWLSTLPNNDYKFKIIATKDDSFDSNFSNEVTIRKLKALDQIKVYTDKESHKTFIKWDITSEQINLVDKILINGEEVLVTERLGQKEWTSENTRIQLISKGESSTSLQYRDSEVVIFSVKEAYDGDYTDMIYGDLLKKPTDWMGNSDLLESRIQWKAFEDDNTWSGNNISNRDLISYIFEVYDSEGKLVQNSEVGGNNYIDITSAILKNLKEGEYSINVYAYFKEYSLVKSEVLGGQGAFLSKYLSSSNITIKKLTPVTDLIYSIDETETNTYADELSKKLTVSWEHSDFAEDIYYNIEFLDENYKTVYQKAVKGVKSLEVTLSEIAQLNISFMRVMAYSPNHIFSNETQIQVDKNRLPQATLSDRGVINITSGSATDRYIIKVEIEGKETNYVLQNKTSEDIFKNFDISKLSENIKGQKEEMTISIIAVGGGSVLPAAKENVITKEILGQGQYDVFGEYIFFRNEFADRVYILYKDGEETKTEILTKQIILNKASNDAAYSYYIPENPLVASESQYMGGFRFKIPESWKGKTQSFTYYFETEGMGSSWFDSTLSEGMKELSVNASGVDNLTEIDIGIDESTNKIYASCAGNVNELFIEVLSGEDTILYGYFKGRLIPIWNMQEIMGGKIPAGSYTFRVWNVKRNAKTSTDYSNIYEFKYTKNENEITNVRVGETGYLEWNDSEEGCKYLLEFGDLNFVVSEKKFDLRLLDTREFDITIKRLGNIPFAERVNISSLENNLITLTDPIEVSNSSLGELKFTPDFTFKGVNEDVELVLEVEQPLEYKIFMEYNKITYPVEKFKTDYADARYIIKIREIDLIDILGEKFTENINNVSLSMTIEGSVKSKSVSVDLSMIKTESESRIEQRKAGNSFDEYLVFSTNQVGECNKVIIRIKDATGIKYDAVQEVVNGYWQTFENTLKNGFYQSEAEGSLSSEIVKVIKISDLLNKIEMPDGSEWTVEVAPIFSGEGISQMEWLNTKASYKRLKGVTSIEVYNKGTKIKWYDTDQDTSVSQYMLSFAKINYYVEKECREFTYDKFEAGLKSDFDVYAVNPNSGILYSQKKSLKDVKRNIKIDSSIVKLEEGTLYLGWGEGLTNVELESIKSPDSSISGPAIDKIFEGGNFLKIMEMLKALEYSVKMMTTLELADKIIDLDYTLPINFNINTFKQESFELRFIQDENSYSLTAQILEIMKKIDKKYIDILKELSRTVSGYDEYNILSVFINALETESYNGIACDYLLFDEIDGGKGNDINSGNYKLVVNQWGNPSRNSLKSSDNTAFEDVIVLQAPTMSCEMNEISNSNGILLTTRYSLTFRPIDGHSKYKLVFKIGGRLYKSFVIEKEGEKWLLKHNINTSGTASSFALSEVGGKVVIPLNSVGKNSSGNVLGIDSIIKFGTEAYDASIYACGTGLEINSKSDNYKLVYLQQSNITMNEGCANFGEYRVMDRVFTPYVIYHTQGASSNAYMIDEVMKNGTVYSYIPGNGKYNFIAFVTRGEVSGYTIFIDSPINLIDKPFKIYSPDVRVKDGYIQIQESPNNQDLIVSGLYSKNYTITNNLGEGSFITSDFTGNSYTYAAGPAAYFGDDENLKAYKATELRATNFDIRNRGSQGALKTSDASIFTGGSGYNGGLGKVLYLKFSDPIKENSRVLFQSENQRVNARMLNSTEISLTKDGNFQWIPISSSVTEGLDVQDLTMIYRLTINYYKETSDSSGNITFDNVDTEEIYTTATEYSAQRLKTFDSEPEKYRYTLSISGMFYGKTGNDVDAITTLENEKYYKQSNVKYSDNESNILRSDTVTTEKLERMAAVTDLTVRGGVISWKYADITDKFKVFVATGSQDQIEIAGKVTHTGNKGDYTFKFEIAEEESSKFEINKSYKLWVMAVDNGVIYGETMKYSKLASIQEQYSSTFVKLPKFTSDKMTVTQDYAKDTVTLNFEEYMNQLNPINSTKNYFKLRVSASVGGGALTDFELNSNKMTLTVYFGEGKTSTTDKTIYMNSLSSLSLTITPETNSQDNIVNANSTNITFSRPSWLIEDSIEWNEENKEFIWTYGKVVQDKVKLGAKLYEKDGEKYIDTGKTLTDEMEYKIAGSEAGYRQITIAGETKTYFVVNEDVFQKITYEEDIKDVKFDIEIVTRENITDKEYTQVKRVYKDIPAEEFDGMKGGRFAPILSGTLESISVYVKRGEKDFASEARELKETISFDYFAGGDGSQANPYLVSTPEQFKLINARASMKDCYKSFTEERLRMITYPYTQIISSSSGTITYNKIYFKQTQDLTLEFTDILITSDFEGEYDGNGKVITINAKNGEYAAISRSESSLNDKVDFTKGVALFKNIAAGGEVKNFMINVSFTNEVGENTIFAAVATENSGTISDITISGFAFAFKSVVTNGGSFISGIVGVNNGLVEDCKNEANINISTHSNQTSMILSIASIASINNGQLIGCGNEGNIVASVNGQVRARVSGIVGYNTGRIFMCYNSASIQASFNGNNVGNAAGIVLYSSKTGDISYVFNQGKIYGAKGNCGGIAYISNKTMESVFAYGEVNGEKGKVLAFKSGNGSVKKSFTYQGNTFSGTTAITSDKTFEFGGYNIVATLDGNKVALSLQKA